MADFPLLKSQTYIYDKDDNMLISTTIIGVNNKNAEIEVDGDAHLSKGELCKMLVMSPEAPQAFSGKIVSANSVSTIITVGNRKTKELRKYRRFKADMPAAVTSLICEGYAYALYKPFEVKLVDISQSGLRIKAPNNAFVMGCRFEVQFKIGDKDEELLAEVVNEMVREDADSEYGCRFYSREKPEQKVAL